MANVKSASVDELRTKLTLLQPGVANKDFIEVTTHYFFTGTHIITYNDKVCVSVPFEFDCDFFSIKAVDFHKIIKGIEEETFQYKIDDNALYVKTDTVKAKIKINTEDFMIKKMFDKLEVSEKKPNRLNNPDEFRIGMNMCKYATSESAHDMVLFSVYFSPKMIASTDNYRVSVYKIKEKFEPFLLPVTVVEELGKFRFNSIHVDENWAYFFCKDDVVFTARLISSKFKDVQKAVDGLEVISEIELPENTIDVLKYLEAMAEDEAKIVFFSIKENEMSMKTEKGNGWLMKTIPLEYKGGELSFHINMSFLFKIIGRIHTMKVCEDRVLFEMENFKHAIALHQKEDETEENTEE